MCISYSSCCQYYSPENQATRLSCQLLHNRQKKLAIRSWNSCKKFLFLSTFSVHHYYEVRICKINQPSLHKISQSLCFHIMLPSFVQHMLFHILTSLCSSTVGGKASSCFLLQFLSILSYPCPSIVSLFCSQLPFRASWSIYYPSGKMTCPSPLGFLYLPYYIFNLSLLPCFCVNSCLLM